MSTHPERMIIEGRTELSVAAATWIAEAITERVRDAGRCSIALSGGTTPRAVYLELTRLGSTVPWAQVDVFFGDERAVPPTDPASNFRMAEEALLSHVPIAPARVHRMEAERGDLDDAARDYERVLPERLDVLLLGMGADGHTASLFPGASTLGEHARRVVPADGPVPPRRRLTITPPVVQAARRVAVIVAGREKAPTLQRVLEGPLDPVLLPVQLALDGTWFVDDDAAALLRRVPA